MTKIQEIFEKISKSPELMNKFKNSQNFEEITEICKEVDPSISQKEIENEMKELSRINEKELEEVAGGKMNFNKMKTLALAALLPFTIVNTSGAVQAMMNDIDVSQKTTSEEKKEEEILLKLYFFPAFSLPFEPPYLPTPPPSIASEGSYLVKLYSDGRYKISFGGTHAFVVRRSSDTKTKVLSKTIISEINSLISQISDSPTVERPLVFGAPENYSVSLDLNGNIYEYCYDLGDRDRSENMSKLIKKIMELSPMKFVLYSM